MGKQWAKSSNGPDWTDVLMTMSALEGMHECHVGLTVIPLINGHNGGGKVEVWAEFATLPGSSLPARVSVGFTWPSGKGLGLVGSAYRALIELDYKIGSSYKQAKLPE